MAEDRSYILFSDLLREFSAYPEYVFYSKVKAEIQKKDGVIRGFKLKQTDKDSIVKLKKNPDPKNPDAEINTVEETNLVLLEPDKVRTFVGNLSFRGDGSGVSKATAPTLADLAKMTPEELLQRATTFGNTLRTRTKKQDEKRGIKDEDTADNTPATTTTVFLNQLEEYIDDGNTVKARETVEKLKSKGKNPAQTKRFNDLVKRIDDME